MSRSSASPPSGHHRVVTTPFLSELIENKKKRSLEIENDYTEHPHLSTARLPIGTAASDADVMRRAFSYARSLPGQLDLERCKISPSVGAGGAGGGAIPPPIPPRPVKSLSCNERRHFVGDDLVLVGARSPPPRPPKSADVIALMMSPNHRRHHPPPPLLHPSLRDRRGDAIETSQLRHHRRHHRSRTSPVVSQPRRKHAAATSPSGKDEGKKEEHRKREEDDDIAREKRRLREEKVSMTSSPPSSCPHCGKCIADESDVTKKHRAGVGEEDEIDIEKGLIRKRMIEEEEEEAERGAMRRWDCSVGCCVETATCMSCVRCCFYHCNKDDNGANLWADKPCACHGVGCRSRWCHLLALSLCFPLIVFYPLARACTASLTTRQRRNSKNNNNHNNKQRSDPADS